MNQAPLTPVLFSFLSLFKIIRVVVALPRRATALSSVSRLDTKDFEQGLALTIRRYGSNCSYAGLAAGRVH